jgi:hypothetical protein
LADINEPFEAIVDEVAKALAEIGIENAKKALVGLGIKDPGILNEAITEVAKYARHRAADMVGMQWLDNTLLADPNAEMAITSLTQEGIRTAVANVLKAFEEGEIDSMDTAAMAQELLSQYAFSSKRSGVIADFEGRRAASKGFVSAWKAAGITGKMSVLSPLHDVPDVCEDIEAMGVVDVDSNFAGYGFGPPWHPGGCRCSLAAVRAEDDLDEDYLDEVDKGLTIFELAKM